MGDSDSGALQTKESSRNLSLNQNWMRSPIARAVPLRRMYCARSKAVALSTSPQARARQRDAASSTLSYQTAARATKGREWVERLSSLEESQAREGAVLI